MKAALLAALRAAREGARPVVLATALPAGDQVLIDPAAMAAGTGTIPAAAAPGPAVSAPLLEAARAALATDAAGTVEIEGASVFLQPFNPPLRLIVVGAVHIAQPLSRMAALADFAVTLVDPRSAFATAERFPDVTHSGEWPDRALALLRPDRRSAVVTLTHDPKLDDPALEAALRSEAFYVGSLGSRKTHAARLARLALRGFSPAELARIEGPVGLAIGARTPSEIAVSILAGIVRRLRQRDDR